MNPPSHATIRDIAERAGVSTATVSYVVNGTRPVSPALAERVRSAVSELGYAPNAVARSLRQHRTQTVGLVVPDHANPFFAELAKGVEDEAFESGYAVLLCNSNAMPERELKYLDVLRGRRVDGIIFSATTPTVEQLRPLVQEGIPVVSFYRDVGDLAVDTLRVDNLRIGYLATAHLIGLGHRRIACIRPASISGASSQRVEGYRRALEDAGLEVDEALIAHGDNLISGGRVTVEGLLTQGRPFTAIFAGNDAMAIGAMGALYQAGLQVPEDVSVVGVDDIVLASLTMPPLTTVSQPKYEAGRQAFQFLLSRIEQADPAPPKRVLLESTLVIRKSTAAPPR